MLVEKIKGAIRDVPDFPKPGIIFKDITPIFYDQSLCREITEAFVDIFKGEKIDAIVGVESRGFLFGLLLANRLHVPFVLVRKSGKLPYKVISHEYDLEYGSAKIEMHIDAIKPGWNVLVHDDLLATGGTAAAAAHLIKQQGASVAGFAFLVELEFLGGGKKLEQFSDNIISLVHYS
jgi:adenine phosphoribosyltransferase